jgi:hypothetical protein
VEERQAVEFSVVRSFWEPIPYGLCHW